MKNSSTATTDTGRKPQLVLIAGWGHRASVWNDLATIAEPWFDVRPLELPGYDAPIQSGVRQTDVAQVVEELAQAIPRHTIVCGWSLGGMLATRLAAVYPERVGALVTLCSNPLFAARDDWPAAMPAATFAEFSQQLGDDPAATLSRFQGLAAAGSSTAKQDLRRLRELLHGTSAPSDTALIASLELLAGLDVRVDVSALAQVQLHLLGREDSLVPAAAAIAIANLNPAARVEVLPDVAHLPMVTNPGLVLERLLDALNCGASNVASA